MNRSTLRNLGIVLFALIAILIGFEMSDRDTATARGEPLFADLKDRLNEVTSVTVERPQAPPNTLSNASGTWAVSSRADYPASVAKIREVLLAIADAQVLEQKTANPARYAQLGVNDPETADSEGIRITLAGDGFEYGVIVGKVNQGSNRYVRVAGNEQSLLIDQNPALPDGPGGWLRTDIVDVDSADVRTVTIRHADGEAIAIAKAAQGDANFSVPDLPDGRELSYPTAANSIGGGLNDLTLDDVRRAEDGDAVTTTEVVTFDGLRIVVAVSGDENDTWLSFMAEVAEPDTVPADADAGTDDDEALSAEDADAATSAEPVPDPAALAAAINARVQGWQYKVPDFKKNQLTRRWDDILKAEEAPE